VDDSTQSFFGYPQGYFLTAWLLIGVSVAVLVSCLVYLRRAPVPAGMGALGSLSAGLTWGIYLGHDLIERSGAQATSVFSLPNRHPSVLLWTHLAGVVFLGLAVVLGLRALANVQKRA
jgi:hypothetical protein